jgi:hypothetical protein
MFTNPAAQDLQTTHNGEPTPPQRSPWRVLIAVLTAVATSAVFVAAEGFPLGSPKSAGALDNTFVPRLVAGGGQLGHSGDGQNAVCPTAPGCAGELVGRINYPIGMFVYAVVDSGRAKIHMINFQRIKLCIHAWKQSQFLDHQLRHSLWINCSTI